MRFMLLVAFMVTCAACVDTTAVQTFAKMAPEPAAIQQITRDYTQELDRREDIKLLGDDPPSPNLAEEKGTREKQELGIEALDTSIREYMQALGALAAGGVVQSSANVKQLTDGLTAWQKAVPGLGITSSQITIVGDFVQSIADLTESGYRNAKLSEIIGKSESPFQQLIEIQTGIASRGITPSIIEVQNSLNDNSRVLEFISEDLQTWAGWARANRVPTPNYANRNPTYGELGAADAHVARYLLKRSLEEDQAFLATEQSAAESYAKALQAIGRAHTALYNNRKNVLTKGVVDQIRPLAQEVHKDFQDLAAYQSKTPSH
jgi:hypothetical protein